jgi:hypothetical protein
MDHAVRLMPAKDVSGLVGPGSGWIHHGTFPVINLLLHATLGLFWQHNYQ